MTNKAPISQHNQGDFIDDPLERATDQIAKIEQEIAEKELALQQGRIDDNIAEAYESRLKTLRQHLEFFKVRDIYSPESGVVDSLTDPKAAEAYAAVQEINEKLIDPAVNLSGDERDVLVGEAAGAQVAIAGSLGIEGGNELPENNKPSELIPEKPKKTKPSVWDGLDPLALGNPGGEVAAAALGVEPVDGQEPPADFGAQISGSVEDERELSSELDERLIELTQRLVEIDDEINRLNRQDANADTSLLMAQAEKLYNEIEAIKNGVDFSDDIEAQNIDGNESAINGESSGTGGNELAIPDESEFAQKPSKDGVSIAIPEAVRSDDGGVGQEEPTPDEGTGSGQALSDPSEPADGNNREDAPRATGLSEQQGVPPRVGNNLEPIAVRTADGQPEGFLPIPKEGKRGPRRSGSDIEEVITEFEIIDNGTDKPIPEDQDIVDAEIVEDGEPTPPAIEGRPTPLAIEGRPTPPAIEGRPTPPALEAAPEKPFNEVTLGTMRIGDVAVLIREAAERDLMADVNSGNALKRFGKKVFKLNTMVREAWLQRRQAVLTEMVEGKSIEELYDVLSSLDSNARDSATADLLTALVEQSELGLVEGDKKKMGTGDAKLDAEIRGKIKEIVSEFLAINSPTPDQRKQYEQRITDYMKDVATNNKDILNIENNDPLHNFIGVGAAEILNEFEKIKSQLEATMDHEDAMERVKAELDRLKLAFGELHAGANGELAHTKFNDTMERLRSKNTRLGHTMRQHRGFAIGCAAAFGVGLMATRMAPNTATRVLGIATLGGSLAFGSYFARQQALARSQTDTQLSKRMSARGEIFAEDNGVDIGLKKSMQARHYNTITYNDAIESLEQYLEINPDTGEMRVMDGLSPEQLNALIDNYAATRTRLELHRGKGGQLDSQGLNLFATVSGQSIKGGMNKLGSVLEAVRLGIEEPRYANLTFSVNNNNLTTKEITDVLLQRHMGNLIATITDKDAENIHKTKVDGRVAAIVAPIVGATVAIAAAELTSTIAGHGLQNPITMVKNLFSFGGHNVPATGNINNGATQTISIGKSTVTLPTGSQITTAHGHAILTTPDGKSIDIALTKNYAFTNTAIANLKNNGFDVNQVATAHQTTKTVTMSSEHAIDKLGGNRGHVGNWLDYGTPKPEGAELGQSWSVTEKGDVVIRQSLGYTHGGGEHVNLYTAGERGKINVYFRSGNQILKVPMHVRDGALEAVIRHNSPKSAFFDVKGGHITTKADFVHVGVEHGKHDFSSVSTVIGHSNGRMEVDVPITTKTYDITIKSIDMIKDSGPGIEDDWFPPLVAYAPMWDPNQAERVERGSGEAPVEPTPEPAPDADSSDTGPIKPIAPIKPTAPTPPKPEALTSSGSDGDTQKPKKPEAPSSSGPGGGQAPKKPTAPKPAKTSPQNKGTGDDSSAQWPEAPKPGQTPPKNQGTGNAASQWPKAPDFGNGSTPPAQKATESAPTDIGNSEPESLSIDSNGGSDEGDGNGLPGPVNHEQIMADALSVKPLSSSEIIERLTDENHPRRIEAEIDGKRVMLDYKLHTHKSGLLGKKVLDWELVYTPHPNTTAVDAKPIDISRLKTQIDSGKVRFARSLGVEVKQYDELVKDMRIGERMFYSGKNYASSVYVENIHPDGAVDCREVYNPVTQATPRLIMLSSEEFKKSILNGDLAFTETVRGVEVIPELDVPTNNNGHNGQRRRTNEKLVKLNIGISEQSKYPERQDYVSQDVSLSVPEHNIYGVFDGMGGNGGNPRAAAEAVSKAVYNVLSETGNKAESSDKIKIELIEAFEAAREAINTPEAGGGSTVATVVKIYELNGNKVAGIAHAGDTRMFIRKPNGEIKPITFDQSKEGYKTANGIWPTPPGLTAEEKKNFGKNREELGEKYTEDEYLIVGLEAGDRILICSDGITGDFKHQFLSDEEMQDAFGQPTAEECAKRFLEISKKEDDKTVIALDVL